jgi:short-subunit dehydrogenase
MGRLVLGVIMTRDLRGRVIVITGSSSGIGAATALACARAGMDVVLGARRADRLAEVAGQVEALGARALVRTCDVRRDADVQGLVDATVAQFGRLDVMFANAGYGLCAPTLETSDQQVREIFETNFYGTLRCLRAALPVMQRQGHGHLVICSSAASEVAPPLYGAYAATKAAQDSVACALRAEMSGNGISVSSVHPIVTTTEFFAKIDEISVHPGKKAGMPGGGKQSPEHVAACIVRCLRRPQPEVWPSLATRFGVGIAAAFPFLAAWGLKRHMRKVQKITGNGHF